MVVSPCSVFAQSWYMCHSNPILGYDENMHGESPHPVQHDSISVGIIASCAGVGPQTAAPQAMRVFRCWAHRYPARRQQLPTHSAGSLTQQAATRPPCVRPRWALG
jgi:hypothetical protein